MKKNLFWTGGFDSTFRLLQLIEDEKVKSINLFYLALNIDNIENSSVKRQSIKNEIKSISKILALIDTSKLEKFSIYGNQKDLIEYALILSEYKFINFIIRDEIKYSNDIINAYATLYDIGVFHREKTQYGSITQLINELDIKAEVCIEKDGGIYQFLQEVVDKKGKLLPDTTNSEIYYIFGKYEMPLFWIDKRQMIEESSKKNWIIILNETWSCWYPAENKECGYCFACERRPFLSFARKNMNKTTTELIDDIYEIEPNFKYFSDYEIDNLTKSYDELFLSSVKNDFKESNKMRVTANIATQPKRFLNLLMTLDSIKGQFDEIRIYLNGYKEVPEELKSYTTFIGKDLTDNGKMFWSNNENEYYFSIDDDIIYPEDYVEKTIPHIKNRIVTYHGKKTIGLGQSYYNSHISYKFFQDLDIEKVVEIGGTGVMAFNTNVFKPTLWSSPIKKMCDLVIGLEAALYNIPIVCLPHTETWIKMTMGIESLTGDKPNGIFEEYQFNDDKQSTICDMIQMYKNNEIREKDLLRKAGSVEKKDVYLLNETIKTLINDHKTFYHLGSGDGKLTTQMSLISEFDKLIGIDTVAERIKFSQTIAKEISKYDVNASKTEFVKSKLDDVQITENSVVYLNDLNMNIDVTNKIFDKLPQNSILICHNNPNGIFPTKHLQVKCSWNRFLNKKMFFYLKS